MNRTKALKRAICLSALLLALPSLVLADGLRVTVRGVKAGEGILRVGAFDEAHREEFSEGQPAHGVDAPATETQMSVEIEGLAPGQYAIAVYQDLNENGKLDRNFLTIPREPYGFSGAWKSGAASYEEALIEIQALPHAIEITLK